MRVYIAGPMTGLPEWNYPAFNHAATAWRNAGWDAVNPAESFDGATDRPYRDYVEADLDLLQTCDAIAMLPGWDAGHSGAIWEFGVAKKLLGLPVYDATSPVAPPFSAVAITRGGPYNTLGRWLAPDALENSYGR